MNARLARRPKGFRAGLHGDMLSGKEREANAATRACRQPQQKDCEVSGLRADKEKTRWQSNCHREQEEQRQKPRFATSRL